MLTRIRLQNFQSHADTELELVSGVNVIVGRTDSGKTAVLRALRWAKDNRPAGTGMIRQDKTGRQQTPCVVEVDYAGHSITRERGKRNIYTIDGKEYRKFGQSVPDEVEDALWDDLSFQSQTELQFLVLDPSSQVARIINAVSGVDVADKMLQFLRKNERDTKHRIDYVLEQIEETEEELDQPIFSKLDEYESVLNSLEQVNNDLEEATEYGQGLISLCEEIQDKEEALEQLAFIDGGELTSLEEDARATTNVLQETVAFVEGLEDLVNDICDTEDRIAELGVGVEDIQDTLFDELLVLLEEAEECPVCSAALRNIDDAEAAAGGLYSLLLGDPE